MLHHMGAEECVGEAIERRGDGEPDDGEAEKECGQPPDGKQRGPRLANGEPAASVDDGRESQSGGEEERRRPLLKDGPDTQEALAIE